MRNILKISLLTITALFISIFPGINAHSSDMMCDCTNIIDEIKKLHIEAKTTKPIEIEIIQYEELGEFVVTGYCPCIECCGKIDGITASGIKGVANHTIAADVNVIPFGSIIQIGDVEYTVEDVGGKVNGKHVDIFFETHQEALQCGKTIQKVYLIK